MDFLAGVNTLSEDGNLQFHQLVFQCGWATKNLLTAFDYIFNSGHKDSVCGKILSKCNQKNHMGENIGECLADASCINTHKDLLHMFVENLFHNQKDYLQDVHVKNLLVGAIFLWEDNFIEILRKESPQNDDSSSIPEYIFLNTISKAKNEVGT